MMIYPAGKPLDSYFGRGLLIDTNILLLLIVGGVDRGEIVRYRRTRVFAEEDYDMLIRLISKFRPIATTAHILTETSYFLEDLKGDRRIHAMQALCCYIQCAEDQSPSHLELSEHDPVLIFGLADGAITLTPSEYLVLTDDSKLHSYLEKTGRAAMNFNHLRQYNWGLSGSKRAPKH